MDPEVTGHSTLRSFLVGDNSSSVESSDADGIGQASARDRQDKQEDEPATMVRKDDLQVRSLSWAVLILLISVASATVATMFWISRSSEITAFKHDFQAVAKNLVEKLRYDSSQKFYLAQSVANSVVATLEDHEDISPVNTSFSEARWHAFTRFSRRVGSFIQISWNPLVSNLREKTSFEESVQSASGVQRTNPPCFMCFSADQGFINRDEQQVLQAGRAPTNCGIIDDNGRTGQFRRRACPQVRARHNDTCICGPVPAEAAIPIQLNDADPTESLYKVDAVDGGIKIFEPEEYPVLALRQMAFPGVNPTPPLWTQNSEPVRDSAIKTMVKYARPVFTEIFTRTGPYYDMFGGKVNDLSSVIYYPVIAGRSGDISGAISLEFIWNQYVSSTLPPHSENAEIVVESSLGTNHTFGVDKTLVGLVYKGAGDLHERKFDGMEHASSFVDFYSYGRTIAPRARTPERNTTTASNTTDAADSSPFETSDFESENDYPSFRFIVYPTSKMEDDYITKEPIVFMLVATGIFLFTSLVFIVYDGVVQRRQAKVMETAGRMNALIVSLFPPSVRDRLYERAQKQKDTRAFDDNEIDDLVSPLECSEQIADYFPEATIMFLDLVGFTAWSSEREPNQVFKLLETIYGAFDGLAQRMGVFKVETIGDCYLAVCGLPKANPKHAVIMAKFAHKCLREMARLTNGLVNSLGPSTGNLKARAGLHSGPVTAGVLRGAKSRFQLFGDSVNTAARMESSGQPFRVHSSAATAELLIAAGKNRWVSARQDRVTLKGKGEMQTYWLSIDAGSVASTSFDGSSAPSDCLEDQGMRGSKHSSNGRSKGFSNDKHWRLVEWNVGTLATLLEKVLHHRTEHPLNHDQEIQNSNLANPQSFVDEVVDTFAMPGFVEPKMVNEKDRHAPSLDIEVRQELHDFVTEIAKRYRLVPFHNFEHASHVMMSAAKFMKRLVGPDEFTQQQYRCSHGMSEDPLMHFALSFSALIHDVGHPGLTNAELTELGVPLAGKYQNNSISEQNSLDIAFGLLFEKKGRFERLRSSICPTNSEAKRFRQMVINAVIATDITRLDCQEQRRKRWEDVKESPKPENVIMCRKATVVYEYLIQAADVAHCMQHWETYQRFNTLLFEERYIAWLQKSPGAAEPSLGWYQGELAFFDNYVIPLAKALVESGDFGPSFSDCLKCAQENRNEWERTGSEIVVLLLEDCHQKFPSPPAKASG